MTDIDYICFTCNNIAMIDEIEDCDCEADETRDKWAGEITHYSCPLCGAYWVTNTCGEREDE